jgi:hypothetical protein
MGHHHNSLHAATIALRAGLAVTFSLAALSARASGGGDSAHAAPAHGAEGPGPAAPSRTDILDLGTFRIRSSQPADHEIIDIRLGVYLVLSSEITAADYGQLGRWKHRLRDQTLIAVRSAEPADFDDPELRRLHRLILFRIKRLPIARGIIGAHLTDFSLDHGETLADSLVPTITPSAAPEKKPAGGGGH